MLIRNIWIFYEKTLKNSYDYHGLSLKGQPFLGGNVHKSKIVKRGFDRPLSHLYPLHSGYTDLCGAAGDRWDGNAGHGA